jgi:hypothetical protein
MRRSVLFAAFLLLPAAAAETEKPVEVNVVASDTNKGLEADVFWVKADSARTELKIAKTDAKGHARIDAAKCKDGNTITAKPRSALYRAPAETEPCQDGDNIVITLLPYIDMGQYLAFANDAALEHNYALAAQAYTELSAAQDNPDLKISAYKNTALALGLPENKALDVDIKQKSTHPSSLLNHTIKAFQRKHKLAETGEIDAETLKALAGGSARDNLAWSKGYGDEDEPFKKL